MGQFARCGRKIIDELTLSTGCEETRVLTSTVCPLMERSTEVNVLLLIMQDSPVACFSLTPN